MSSDPKKPFDAPPPQTPDLLQKELGLDRRRRVPTFEELQAVRPSEVTTDPMRPAAQRPAIDNVPTQQHQAQPAEPWQTTSRVPPENELPTLSLRTVAQGQPRPVGLVMPTGIDPRTQPMRPAVAPARPPAAALPQAPRAAAPAAPQAPRAAMPGTAAPPAAPRAPMPAAVAPPRAIPGAMPAPTAPPQARAAMPAPTAPPQAPRAAMPAPAAAPRAPTPAAIVAPAAPRAAVAPPAPARVPTPVAAPVAAQPPAVAPRQAPPSPTEFAQARPAMPQIMASVPSQGAVKPEGQVLTPPRAQPAMQTPVHQIEADEPEPRTLPSMPVQRPHFTPPPTPAVKAPNELPREMLVTQPGIPGPFAAREVPPSMPEMPKVAGPTSMPALPKFDEPLVPTSDTVTAEPAALWRRSGAWLTDLLFVSVLVLGLLFVAMEVIAPKHGAPLQQLMAIALPGAGLAAMMAFVYTTLFAFLWQGRTPGRRLMGIHLVDTTGHAPGPVRALARAMLSLVSFALFLSGFWLALFDRHGQTLHDKLTRTFVVKLQDA